jgi:hypothetical protein
MGMGRAHEDGATQFLERQVVEIGALAGDEARVLAPLRGGADPACIHAAISRGERPQGKPGLRRSDRVPTVSA